MTTTKPRRLKSPVHRIEGDHPLAHRIPPKSMLDMPGGYVNRTIYGEPDFGFMDYCLDMKRNIMFVGDTQVGKTMLVSAFGAWKSHVSDEAVELPVITINANGGIDPNTFFGMWSPDAEGNLSWTWSEIALVIMHGGILFVDEVNFMVPRTSATFHSLADARRQVTVLEQGNKVIQASDNFLLVVAYNHGYEGTRPLNAAFKQRFIPVELDYDTVVEEELLCMPVTMDLAENLREARKQGDIRTPVGTGSLVVFEEMCADIGPAAAIECLVTRFEPEEREAVREVIKLAQEIIFEQASEMSED